MKIGLLFVMISLCFSALHTEAQVENSAVAVMDYREVDGRIVVEALLNGKPALLALDLSGHNAILEEYLDDYGIDSEKIGKFPYKEYVCRSCIPAGSVIIDKVSIGNLASGLESSFFVLKDAPELKEMGVVGTINAVLFQTCVLTIDARRKKLTTTAPYRPTYMKLTHRQNAKFVSYGAYVLTECGINGQSLEVALDTWSKGGLNLTASDFTRVAGEKTGSCIPVPKMDFSTATLEGRQVELPGFNFVRTALENVKVVENPCLKHSVIGLDILKEGILSIDIAKDKVYFQFHDMVEIDDAAEKAPEVKIEEGKLNAITRDYFIEHIFDYRDGEAFQSKSDRIIVIDFWATWCGPCMRLLPEMEKMAAEYKGRVLFLKVNADKEKELCSVFGIQALPTLMFIAPGKEMIRDMGAAPERYREIIESLLK